MSKPKSEIVQANADGTLKDVPKVAEPITLFPFEDGTVVKYSPRGGQFAEQQQLVNFKGDVLAIAKDANCAAMLCDGVNVMFAALTKKADIENSIKANLIADLAKLRNGEQPTTEKTK